MTNKKQMMSNKTNNIKPGWNHNLISIRHDNMRQTTKQYWNQSCAPAKEEKQAQQEDIPSKPNHQARHVRSQTNHNTTINNDNNIDNNGNNISDDGATLIMSIKISNPYLD